MAAGTVLMGAMITTASVDLERHEESVQLAANGLRPSRCPLLFAKAALALEDFEKLRKVLRFKTRKIRNLRKSPLKD